MLFRSENSDLPVLGSVGRIGNTTYANFSIGLATGIGQATAGSLPAATQVQVSLRRGSAYTNYSIGTFMRQVAPFVMMQLETVDDWVYARVWAKVLLEGASVVYVQYAWGDMEWITPVCQSVTHSCFNVQSPCVGKVRDQTLELWVPIGRNLSLDGGNLSLYFEIGRAHV